MTDDEVVRKAREESYEAIAYGWTIVKLGRTRGAPRPNVGQLRRLERAGLITVETVTIAPWKNSPKGVTSFYLVRAV